MVKRLALVVPIALLGCGHFLADRPALTPLGVITGAGTAPSGLRYVIEEQPEQRFVRVTLSVGAGAATEPAGKEGVAHLAAHLALLGHERGAPRVDALAAQGIDLRLRVGADDTVFVATGEPGRVEAMVAAAGSWMRAPLAGLTEQEFAAERERVAREVELDARSGGGAAYAQLLAAAFSGHPYARYPLGSPASVRRLTIEDVRGWLAASFVPSKTVVVFTGSVTSQRAASALGEGFGGLLSTQGAAVRPAAAAPLPPLPAVAPDMAAVTVPAPVEAPELYVAWRIAGRAEGLPVMARWVAGRLESRLTRELCDVFRKEDLATRLGHLGTGEARSGRLAASVAVYVQELDGAGLLTVHATLERREDAGYVLDLLRRFPSQRGGWATSNDLGLSPEEAGARELRLASLLERLDGAAVATGVRLQGRASLVTDWQKAVMDARRSGDKPFVERWLGPEAAMAVLVVPDGRADLGGQELIEDPEEHRLSPLGEEVALAGPGPAVEKLVLSNGLRVVVARRPGVPTTYAALVLPGRPASPAVERAALGATYAIRFDHAWALGADYDLRALGDALVLEEDVLAGNWAHALEDLSRVERYAEVGYESAFAENAKIWARALEDGVSRPSFRADEALYGQLLGADPRGQLETPARALAVTFDQIERWLNVRLAGPGATLVLSGAVPEEPALRAELERRIGNARVSPRLAVPAPAAPRPARAILSASGAKETRVIVGWRTPSVAPRDRAVVLVFAEVLRRRLEGVFAGPTASAPTRVLVRTGSFGSIVTAEVAVKPSRAQDATTAVVDAAHAIAAGQLSPGELARARAAAARQLSRGFDTVEGTGRSLVADVADRGEAGDGMAALYELAKLEAGAFQSGVAELAQGAPAVVEVGP